MEVGTHNQQKWILDLALEPCIHSVVESEGGCDNVVRFARQSGFTHMWYALQWCYLCLF